jgi:hypothetical protein
MCGKMLSRASTLVSQFSSMLPEFNSLYMREASIWFTVRRSDIHHGSLFMMKAQSDACARSSTAPSG